MKIFAKLVIAAAMVLASAFVSCRKIADKPEWKITMTTAKAEIELSMGGVGTAIIDFGDGSKDTVTFVEHEWINFSHKYSDETLRTIIITGEIAGLDCGKNQLITLDTGMSPALESLYCSENQLTHLDVNNLSGLGSLACSKNQLTSLDVSRLTKLERLYCRENQLTSLNVSGLAKLNALGCQYNYMNTAALNDLFASLPTVDDGDVSVYNNGPDYDGSGSKDCDASIAEEKGWTVNWK